MLIYRTRLPGEQSSLRRLPQRLINSRACLTLSSSPPRTMYSETRGEAYARKLWEAGVRVTCTRYIGTIHDFVMLNAIADAPAARSAIAQANAALISALQ